MPAAWQSTPYAARGTTGVKTVLPWSRPLTRDDLDTMPDDGHRYELIDGALIVTPAPRWPHHVVVGELSTLLRAHCPPDLQVLFAPLEAAGCASYWVVDPLAPSTLARDLVDGRCEPGDGGPGRAPRLTGLPGG